MAPIHAPLRIVSAIGIVWQFLLGTQRASAPDKTTPSFSAIYGLPFLECTHTNEWDPFRTALRHTAASGWDFEVGLSSGLFDMAVELSYKWSKVNLYDFHCLLEEQGGLFKPNRPACKFHADVLNVFDFCFLGFLCAVVVNAWDNFVTRGWDFASFVKSQLMFVSTQLRMNDLDLMQETLSWSDISSWDILLNLRRLMEGQSFEPHPTFRPRRERTEDSWEPIIQLPHIWPDLTSSAVCGLHCDVGHALKLRASHDRVHIWWVSTHPSVVVDILDAFTNLASSRHEVVISHNLISYHCTAFSKYCSQDEGLLQLLRAKELSMPLDAHERSRDENAWSRAADVIRDFADIVSQFSKLFGSTLASSVDIFMCGHPLYLCRLFESEPFGRSPVLGFLDMPWNLRVPAPMLAAWKEQLKTWLQDPYHVIVSAGPFPAMQLELSVGLKVAYTRFGGFGSHRTSWEALHQETVVLTRSPTWIQNLYLLAIEHYLAQITQPHLLKFVRWPDDLSCDEEGLKVTPGRNTDTSSCSIGELAKHRGVVVWPYDITHMKFVELYDMGVPIFTHNALWRWTTRWGMMEPAEEENGNERHTTGMACNMTLFESLGSLHPWSLPDGICPPYSQSRSHLDPVGSSFWAEISEFAQRPHLQYFSSAAQLLEKVLSLEVHDLQAISTNMRLWQNDVRIKVALFWQAAFARMLTVTESPESLAIFKGDPTSAATF